MRKFKIGLFLFIGLSVFYLAMEYFLFTRSTYHCENCQEEITVHFIHGSYPKEECTDQRNRVGGLLGGHVEIAIDSLVFGFEFKDQNDIHIFPRENPGLFNSKFTRKTKADWLDETVYDKMTSIHILIESAKKVELTHKLQMNYQHIPYDYCFFGMRCASSTYEDLSSAGVLPEKSRVQYIVNAFYPRQLRKRMVQWAKHNHLIVDYKKGIDCRVWE